MQAGACCLASLALLLKKATHDGPFGVSERHPEGFHEMVLLVVVIVAGCIEALGANLASISVKKDWVPCVFEGAAATDLARVNTTMSNIDLVTEVVAPIAAGFVLQFCATDGELAFLLIAAANVISFVPEVGLLYWLYCDCERLHYRSEAVEEEEKVPEAGEPMPVPAAASPKKVENAWMIWMRHPSGLPLLTLSYAALFFTALSPHGVVLTAYLMVEDVSPALIGAFRGAGAIAGVIGIACFTMLRRGKADPPEEGPLDVAENTIIPELRRLNLRFVGFQCLCVVAAACAFTVMKHEDEDERIQNSTMTHPVAPGWVMSGVPTGIALFAACICLSRIGLYGFDLGLLELEQLIVDERFRSAAGSVENALCALAELGVYAMSIVLPHPSQFIFQVRKCAWTRTSGRVGRR
mmetsp:Transcript_18123/g.68691  ORF Transcript_18123/g.68691 Transcript_18123/m.68691 type:complete len:410 (-) Transcript_18123:519-1748(-)